MKTNLHRFFKHCTTLFVLALLVTNCEKDIEIKNNPKQNNHSEQPQEINGITFLNVDTLLEDTDFQILQKNGVRVVKENNTHILITKEFSSPIYNDMIAKRYDGSKIIFSLTAVDNKNRFLDDNKQYDFTIDTALGIVYSNTQILTDLGIKNDNTAGKIAPVIRISYIYVTYEKSCDGTVNGVPQLHSYDNRSECSWNGSSKGPQRWTQVFVVSGSGLSTQGYNYNHYSDNNDDGPGGSSFVPFGGTPKIFVRNISKVGEAILVPYVLNFPQTVSDFIKEDPVFVSFLFKYLNYNGFTNDGIQVAHHWVQKYHDTSDMVYFDKIVELAKAAAADVHSLITFLELDDEQTYWIMDNAGVRNQLIAFAKANNTPQAKAFAVETVAVFSGTTETIISDNQIDYAEEILRLTNHLKNFGNIEDKIYADYIQSLIPNFNDMTINEVRRIYSEVKTTCNNLTIKYFEAITTVVVADLVMPVVTYALFEATAGTAIKLLQKIPVAMVLKGYRLNRLILNTTKLGTPGYSNSRLIPNSTVNKAEALFATLTKDAISVAPSVSNPSVIVANMGNGLKIILRPNSTTVPSAVRVIEYQNFNNLLGTNSYTLKFTP